LNGNGLTGNGLEFAPGASSSSVKGLSIVGFGTVDSNAGIYVAAGNVTVAGNLIGLLPNGTAVPNAVGIYVIGADNSTIGGTTAESRNVVSGNTYEGITFQPAGPLMDNFSTGHTIQNNFVGTNVYGTSATGNGMHGIDLDGANNSYILDNVVGGNSQYGIGCDATYAANPPMIYGVTIMRNRIGIGVNGENIGNGVAGIMVINAHDIVIGSSVANANIISNNGTNASLYHGGVIVKDYPAGTSNHCYNVQITYNRIYNNTGLGIDLNGDGVTANDNGDNDAGPNGLLNFPVIESAYIENGDLKINGTLETDIPNSSFNVVFFNNPDGIVEIDPTSYGECYVRIGLIRVTTDENGDASFTATYPPTTVAGSGQANYRDKIVSFARSATENTSEFSHYKEVTASTDSVCIASFPIRTYSTTTVAEATSYTWSVPTGALIISGQGTTSINVDWSGVALGSYIVTVKTVNDCGENIAVKTPVAVYQCATDLAITKIASTDPVFAGNTLTYTITASNTSAGAIAAQNVTVNDVLPAGLTATGATPSAGTWSAPTWTIGTLNTGATATLTITTTVNSTFTGATISNTANLSSTTPDANAVNNTATTTTTVNTQADVAISKTCTTSPLVAGQVVNYTLALSNAGPSDALNVTVADVNTSLTGMEYSTDNVVWNTWTSPLNLGTIVSGSSTTRYIRGILIQSATGSLNNTATVSSSTTDANSANNTSTATSVITTSADLTITKVCNTSPLLKNETGSYTITVHNNGPSDATSVSIADVINTVYLSNPEYSTNGGSLWNTWTSPLSIGTLSANSTYTFQISGMVTNDAPSPLSNTASVSSATADPVPGNNTATVSTPLNESADISVTLTGSASVTAGTQIAYTVTVTNNDNNFNASNVVISDNFNASYISNPQYSTNGGSTWYSFTGTYTIGTINTTSSVTILLRATVLSLVNTNIPNTVTVTSDTPDPSPANNTASTSTPVIISSDLQITKTMTSAQVIAGQLITWDIAVRNLGPSDAAGVTVTDVPPPGLINVQYSNDGGNIWVSWPVSNQATIGDLAFSQALTFKIRAMVNTINCGTIANTASVSSTTDDPVPGNNSSSVSNTPVTDQTAPTITCPAPVTVSCVSDIPAVNTSIVTASDNCSETPVITHRGDVISNQTCENKYTVTRTYRTTDASGNYAECSHIITVNDQTPPTITAPAPVTVQCSRDVPNYATSYSSFILLSGASVTDNCSTGTITVTHVSDAISNQSCNNKYTLTRTYRATDACGNFADCQQVITVNDITPPTFTTPANKTIACNDSKDPENTGLPVIDTGNCGGTNQTYSYTDAWQTGPACNGTGVITRTWSVTDQCGNTATAIQSITIIDNTLPQITCTGDQTRNANTGVCSYTAIGNEFDPVSATDNCGVEAVTYSLSGATSGTGATSLAGVHLSIGETNIRWTVTDACDNTATCNFTVTVNDLQNPTIACVPNISRNVDADECNATVIAADLAPASYGDNCTITAANLSWEMTGVTTGNGTGLMPQTDFNLGITTVTYTITDAASRSASCSFLVRVTDNINPTITCVGDLARNVDAGQCYATVANTALAPTYNDNCTVTAANLAWSMAGATTGSGTGLMLATGFNTGTTTVTYTITDASNNTASCSFDVVVTDNIDPTVSCVANLSRNVDAGQCTATIAAAALAPASYSDNCSATATNLSWAMTMATTGSGTGLMPQTAFNVGTTTVTYTITDAHNRTASCSFRVTATDNINPTITCRGNITQNVDIDQCYATVSATLLSPLSFTDNCPVNSTNLSWSLTGATNNTGTGLMPETAFNLGTTLVTLTITDAAGLPASCSYNVEVVDDHASEVIVMATDQASEPSDNGLFTLNLSHPVCFATTVTFTINGTASEGIDYSTIGTQVTIPAGSTSITVPVIVIDDNLVESGGETVIITLTGTNNTVTIGTTNQATITISDNDHNSVYAVEPTQNIDSYIIGETLATVTDADGIIVSASLSGGSLLPAGTTLNTSTGEINVSDNSLLISGIYHVIITTTDATGGITTQGVSVTFTADHETIYAVQPSQNIDSYSIGQTIATPNDADGTIVSALLSNGTSLPAGLSLNTTTGLITVSNPNLMVSGTYSFDVTTTDSSGGVSTQTITVSFINDHEAVFAVEPPQNVNSYTNGEFLAYVTDVDGAIVSAVLSNGTTLPSGITINTTTGLITVSDYTLLIPGTYTFDITTTDTTGGETTWTVTITIGADNEAAYSIEPAQNIDSYSNGETLATVSDPNGPIYLAVLANGTSLPTGISMNSFTGEIYVTDKTTLSTGTYTLDITTTDVYGGVTTQTITIVISADHEAVYSTLPAQNSDSYIVGEVLSTVTDADGSIVFTALADGTTLPAGTSINTTTGMITVSNPALLVAGSYTFTISTTDASGGISNQTVSITFATDQEAVYTIQPTQHVNSYLNGDLLASVNDADAVITSANITDGTLPSGTSLNTATGEITVSNPSLLVAGSYSFTITTSDATGGITEQTLSITFSADQEAVYSINPVQNINSYVIGESLATVSDADAAIVSAVLVNGTSLPSGMSINATSGLITVNDPTLLVVGSYSFDVTTTDVFGGITTQTITIIIGNDTESVYVTDPVQNINSYIVGETLASVSDADGLIVSAILANGTTLPAGTTLNSTTGLITVSDPTLLSVGTSTFDITTTDSHGGITTQTVTIIFGNDNEAIYTVQPSQNIDSYSNGVTLASVSDGDGAITSAIITSGSLPDGMSLNSSTGEVTVSNSTLLVPDTYAFTVTTTDASGGETTQTITITLNADSEAGYTVVPVQNINSYSNGESLATVSDADGTIVTAVLTNGTTLPSGTSLNMATGEITVSNPSLLVPDSYSFDVSTTDAFGGITIQTVTIIFGNDTESTYTIQPAQNIDNYSNGETLATVNDADGTIVSAIVTSGTLPTGTSLDPVTGQITVNNNYLLVAGTYTLDITTTDSSGGVSLQTITITISSDHEADYSVEPTRNIDSYNNGAILATVSDAEGAIVSATLFGGTILPAGTTLNSSTGEIMVSDNSLLIPGTYHLIITTTDIIGGITTQGVSIILSGDHEAVYTCEPAQNTDSYAVGEIVATLSDVDGAIVSSVVSNGTTLPSGISMNSTTGQITVSDPSQLVAGSFSFDITTTDASGGVSTQTITITLNSDHEAVYAVEPPQNVNSYTNGEILASINDVDGTIASAVLANGTTLPAGVSMNPVSGLITVNNPVLLIEGNYSFDVTTIDATGGVSTQTVTIIFRNDAESVYTVQPSKKVDSYINGDILATVTDADGAIYSAVLANSSVLPSGISLNTVTGEVYVSDHTALISGTYTIDITTIDLLGGVTTQTVSITILPDNEAVYTFEPAQNIDSYLLSETLATVADPDGLIVSAVIANGTSLPFGTSLNPITGEVIVSNPALLEMGTHTFDVTTTDVYGGLSTSTVTVSFSPDTESHYTLQPSGNIDSYSNNETLATVADVNGSIVTAVLTNGTTLPAGTSLNPVTGEVTVSNPALLGSGTFVFDVTTTDASGGVTTQTVSITINADTEAIVTVQPARNIDTYLNGDVLATVTDADGLIVSAVLANSTTLPAGTSMNPVTGEITVSNPALLIAGTYTFDISTTDATGGVTTQTVSITISPDTEAIYSLQPAHNINSYINGESLATVSDADGSIISAILANGTTLPAGTSLNSATGEVTVSNPALLGSGTFVFDITTTDATGGKTIQTVTLSISADNEAQYTIQPSQNIDSYLNGESLGTVNDADGSIVSAVLANGTSLPAGTTLNTTTGEIIVSNRALLAVGTYLLEVTTTDIAGGITTQTVSITINADTEAICTVLSAQNIDNYITGEIMASITDTDGSIVSAVLANGTTLPTGTSLNPATGEVTVSNPALLIAGTYTFDVTTTDASGGVTTQTVSITINADTEAIVTVQPARNIDTYFNGDVLATVTDADGLIVSAVLANSTTLPAGTSLNPVTGEVTVSNPALLIDGTYTFDISTTDATGGLTTRTVSMVINPDTEAIYTLQPAQNIQSYSNGELLASVTDADGSILSTVLANGTTLPAGTSLNPITGEITVSNTALLVAGTYTFEVTTTDATGGVTTQLLTIVFSPDTEAIYTVQPARNIDSYLNGDVLATVTDADGSIVSAVLANSTTLPAGTSLNPVTGEITVSNRALLVAGTYLFDVTTTDGTGGITTQTVSITINADTEAICTVQPAQNIDSYIAGEIVASISDTEGSIVSAVLANGTTLPAGTSLNPVTGEVTVSNPALLGSGTFVFDVTTTDASGGVTTQTVSITINPDTEAIVTVQPARNIDTYLNGDVLATVTDADGLIVSAVLANSTTLPAGTSLNPVTGEVTVSNPALLIDGTYIFDISTTDATGGVTTKTVSIIFKPDIEAIYVAKPARNIESLFNGDVLATVTDADGEIVSITLANGTTLPSGTSLNPVTGEITVSNQNLLITGTYTFDITTTDIIGGVTTQTVTITINPDREAIYTVQPAQNVESYINGEILATVTDADGATVSAILADDSVLPAGTTLNPITGVISVSNPALLVAGTYTFQVTTIDASGGETSQLVTITINPDTEAIYSVQPAQNSESYLNGETLATVTDADGAIISAILVGDSVLPAGTTLNPITGVISVSNPELLVAGTYTFQVTTIDASGGETSQLVTITINPDTEAIYSIQPAQNSDSYLNGDTLATVTDDDGTIVSAILTNGTTLPAGTSLNPITGEITVSNADLLVAGTYILDVVTIDTTGGVTTQAITITFNLDTEAIYAIQPAQNIDSYLNGKIVATVVDTDGPIIQTTLANGTTLPSGISLNPVTGEITVSNPDILVAGSYTFKITTTDSTGGVTTQPVTISFNSDIEAIYVTQPIQNIDTYLNGETLATVTDADGEIISAILGNDTNLPPGTSLNPFTGEITVSNADILVGGTYTFEVTTIDSLGGNTTQLVTIFLTPDIEAIYAVQPSQNIDSYLSGETLANVFDADGSIVSAEVTSGSLPAGTAFNPVTGEIYVIDQNLLVAGSYEFLVTNLDATGGITTQKVVLEFTYAKIPPVAVNDKVTVENGLPFVINELNNDYDVDGTIVSGSVKISTQPKHGNIMIDPVTGSITYSPVANFIGIDSIRYTVADNDGLQSNIGVIYIEVVESVNMDSDGDGVSNRQEKAEGTDPNNPCDFLMASISLPQTTVWDNGDCDSDGVLNGDEITDGPDTDGDGKPNYLDNDDDGDSILTINEDINNDLNWENDDLNKDGKPNYLDDDDDGDGIKTIRERRDLNNNDIPDYLEVLNLVAVNDSIETGIEIPVDINILANDSNIFNSTDISIIRQPYYGNATIDLNSGVINYNPNNDFVGADSLEYAICNVYNQCDSALIIINVIEIIKPPQIFTPDGNGQNDTYKIKYIEKYPNSFLTVYNRWGNKVYESKGYKNDWDGYSNINLVIGKKPLPVGTYFYVLTYGVKRSATGFIYLKR
jgi:gliding motility-associated-like protein